MSPRVLAVSRLNSSRTCRGGCRIGYSLNRASEHIHATGKLIASWLLGGKFDRGGLVNGQGLGNTKVGKADFFQTAAGISAVKVEPHRLTGLHQNLVGVITAIDGHRDFLYAIAGFGFTSLWLAEQEPPEFPSNQAKAAPRH